MEDVDGIIEAICEDYCLWPQEFMSQYEDPDDALCAMEKERCVDCPLMKLKEAINA